MFISLPMVLIADRDSFSNSTLSHQLRRLGLAESVICTTSASNALAYLYKQQICSYPFPDFIIFNTTNLEITVSDFIQSYKVAFIDQYNSKFILMREKNRDLNYGKYKNEELILGAISKPISSEQLFRLFKNNVKKPIYT